MKRNHQFRRVHAVIVGVLILSLACPVWVLRLCQESKAGPPWQGDNGAAKWAFYGREHLHGPQALAGTWYNLPGGAGPDSPLCAGGCGDGYAAGGIRKCKHGGKGCAGCCGDNCGLPPELGGSWFWMRSPEQERTVIASHYNRYCIRCHGVDGRGVWDMPGVPDFTNPRWQLSRSDDQIARITIEGRGAGMPPFRGTFTLEEAWAMARYLRTFAEGTEQSRPDLGLPPQKDNQPQELTPPRKVK